MRYSRGVLGEKYITSTTILFVELVKLAISCVMISLNRELDQPLFQYFKHLIKSSAKMAVPAIIYFAQNFLLFVALENLDAATYSVMQQLKILTTALFYVLLLRKHLSFKKWRALLLLLLGVILVQDISSSCTPSSGKNNIKGVVAVLVITTLSGFAAVWFEKMLKGTQELSLWDRNFQLAFHSVIVALVGILLDASIVYEYGFFYDYSIVTVLVILFSAFGGLLVSLVVKYADNILKGFATSIAIILTSILNYFLFNGQLGLVFSIGTLIVIISIIEYNEEESTVTKPVLVY